MAYITQLDLVDKMPQADIVQACTDSTLTPAQVWDAICLGVSEEIDGLMAPRYARPFPDPVHPRLKTVARWLTLEALFIRRGLYGESNPATATANKERDALRQIGAGKVLLDLATPAPQVPAAAAAAATTEELNTKPGSSRLMC
jgi:hypothetical protein